MAEQTGGEEVPTFELGDRVMIIGGQLDQTRGRIYYMDSDLIRILPDGASDRLIELPLEEGDFAAQLGIENFYLLSKAANPAFVAQIDAQVEQLVDTFGENGEPGIQYTIRSINEGADTMVIEDGEGGRKELAFRSEFHRGIERSEPFLVLRPRYRAEEGAEANENMNTAEADAEEDEILFEDVELPEEEKETFVGLIERPAALRIYPDSVQRNEMFVQLLEMLDTNIQKLPARQRETRQLTEQLLLLRNDLVKYSMAGDPVGQHSTSFQTISELIEKADIPLARPVLDAKRSLYVVGDEEINTDIYKVDTYTLNDIVKQSNTFLDTQLNAAGAGGTDSLPNWYTTWDAFFRTYMRSFSSSGSPGDTVLFRGDKEFLRAPAPREGDMEVDGVPVLGKDSSVTVDKLHMSVLKGVGPRMTRVKGKGAVRRVESGDEGVITTQLIFPLSTERDLGSIRSGSLMRDIQHSHMPSKNLQTTLQELGGVPDEATAGGILSIGENGNTNGNIGIDDWLKAQPLIIRGLGDALIQMKSLGLTQKELTADQQAILIDKVKAYRAAIKHYITEEIESSKAALAALRLENDTFLQGEALEELMTVLSTEPLLATRLDEVKKLLPAYKENDVAIVAAVHAQMSELFLTAMSGQPAPLARERNRRVRDQFLEALRNAMTKARNKEHAGELPTPNHCPHVNDLAAIRQIVDDSERMAHLSAFLTNYKKGREGNWIMCNNCPRPILCYHEELQIQEFKHPREKDVLHKELLLAFSGGQFHGKYMCKNCGQAISDMDFDRGMEFTENGIPLAGGAGAPLEDKGEIVEEAITKLIGTGEVGDGVESYTTEVQKIIYQAASKLYQAVGVYPGNDVLKGVVQRVEAEILLQPSQDEYARAMKARAAKGAAAGTVADYDVFINRVMVSAIAAHVIIEIQTHIPDYVPRYRIPGCVAGFTGYPLGREEDKTILNYISCAVAGITDTSRPWGLSGFSLIQNDKKRQETIAARVETIVKAAMKTAVVQALITAKKVHYETIYGSVEGGGSLVETIPPGFLPVPYVIPPEEAAKAVVIPEAAGPQELTRAWIQAGHRIARQNGKYIRGTPYSEATCCYTPLAEPRGFWAEKAAALPSLPIKQPPIGQHGSQVMFNFHVRRQPRLLADPPDDLFYRVFLRVCYDGPRKGLPHEPGYTNRCPHCGFTFPESPYIENPVPPLSIHKDIGGEMMKEWKAEMDAIITKGKAALESQKVVMTKAAFEELLDTTHLAYRVAVPERMKPVVGMDLLAKFGTIEPEPFDGWREVLMETMNRVAKLSAAADEIEVAEAYGPMSDVYMQSLGEIERRLGAAKRQTLQALLEKSPSQVYETVRTYFLVTFKRILSGFQPRSLKLLKGYDLPTGVEDDIHNEMYARLGFLEILQKNVKGYTMIKLDAAVKQLMVVLPLIQNEVRANLIPGGSFGLPYFVGTLISGILAELINPNVMPAHTTVGAVGTLDATTRVPLNILDTCLIRLETEGLLYTDEQIRERIAKRIEAEKVAILRRMDNMTPDEKRMTLMNQRLGLKEYAVGGTKAIYLLDENQYERERIQRGEMGLATEFGATGEMAEALRRFDMEEAYGGGGDGADGGYDNEQMAADDY